MSDSSENAGQPGGWSFGYSSLLTCVSLVALLVAYYFYVTLPYIRIPADILMFAESDFVGDVIKLRTGLPLFTPPEDSNSLVYTPLSHVLTYLMAWAIGHPTSIPTFRAIQVAYAALAAGIGVLCLWRLVAMRWPDRRRPAFAKTYSMLAFLGLFLAATAPRVNPYAHMLHADALALVVTAFTFWSLLRYLDDPRAWRFMLLAACPAIGFLTKQFLLIWAPLVCVAMLVDNPRSLRRVAAFAGLSGALFGLAVGGCYLLWGDAFIFWIFDIVGGQRSSIGLSPTAYHISLIRSANHLLMAWMEISIGIFGVWLLLGGVRNQRLVAVASVWVLLIAGETLTSGAGFRVLYHFGPGVLVGTIVLLAAVQGYWPNGTQAPAGPGAMFVRAGHSAFAVAAVLTVTVALHAVPSGDRAESRVFPPRPPSEDMNRYIADIEREFDGVPIDSILLDVGNWIYLRQSYLAKDRAISMGDQPPIGIYRNVDGFVGRIRDRHYAKILVRNLRSKFFLYDWHDWPRPSGAREALLQHYREVRVIPGVVGADEVPVSFTGPISVFERNAER